MGVVAGQPVGRRQPGVVAGLGEGLGDLDAAQRGAGIVVEGVRAGRAHQVDAVERVAVGGVHHGVVDVRGSARSRTRQASRSPKIVSRRAGRRRSVARSGPRALGGPGRPRRRRRGRRPAARPAPTGAARSRRPRVGLRPAADVDQAAVGVDVRAQPRAEDGDAAVELLPLQVDGAAAGAVGARQPQAGKVALVEPEASRGAPARSRARRSAGRCSLGAVRKPPARATQRLALGRRRSRREPPRSAASAVRMTTLPTGRPRAIPRVRATMVCGRNDDLLDRAAGPAPDPSPRPTGVRAAATTRTSATSSPTGSRRSRSTGPRCATPSGPRR